MNSALNIARVQFAITAIFHMTWPLLTIGLSVFMLILEALWLKTGNETYYRHVRYWSKIFIVVFGIGVASGIPLEIEFGTNWSRFATAGGDIMGSLLAVEASTAFALEAAFLAIFYFGWDRVGRRMHLFSNAMVALGASLSAFWIMSANSWMQTPAGVTAAGGKITINNFAAAIFNPDLPIAFAHIWAAAIETTLFFVAGICAWNILRNRNKDFFLKAFKVMVIVGIVFTPLQIILGDASGLEVAKNEPTKSAAMEAHWDTNRPGEGAPWVVIAWPDQSAQKNTWEITISDGLSVLNTRSLKGQVEGLRAFPVNDQPPVVLPFYAFRLMVLLGIVMVVLILAALWLWIRKKLRSETLTGNRFFWQAWVWAIPIGFIATWCGWIVREVGRQPWVIYGLMRTSDGVSLNIGTGPVIASLILFIAVYAALFGAFIYFTRRTLMQGPDLNSPLPVQKYSRVQVRRE